MRPYRTYFSEMLPRLSKCSSILWRRPASSSSFCATTQPASTTARVTKTPPAPPPLNEDHHTRIATLANGDQVSYSEVGPKTASPLFFLHGSPSCRLEFVGLADLISSIPVRLVSPDRPGVGYTTLRPESTLLDYPNQISLLAAHLGFTESGYRVVGGSGGGPYAMACAKVLPKSECKAVAVVAGVAPIDTGEGLEGMRFGSRTLLTATKKYPRLTAWLADRYVARYARDPDPTAIERAFQNQMKYFWMLASVGLVKITQEEQLILEAEEGPFVREIASSMREHFRQGSQGFLKEGQILCDPWGFKIEEIEREGVRFFYGSEDINTPIMAGRAMAARMKGAVFKEYPGHTHMTLMQRHGREILEEIMNAS